MPNDSGVPDKKEKWTPGPWEIDRESFNTDDKEGKLCSIRGKFPEDWHVAEVWNDIEEKKADANAQLIAAAPELYEALLAITQKVEEAGSMGQGILDTGGRLDLHFTAAELKAIEAALSKARGEETGQ